MNWFYVQDGQQVGPVDTAELARLAAEGMLRDDTLVWRDGMDGWQAFSAVRSEVMPAVVPTLAPPPPVFASVAGNPLEPGRVRCAECGGEFAADDTIELNGVRICGACKPAHLQRLAQGGPVPAGSSAGVADEHGSVPEAEIVDRDYTFNAVERFTEAWNLMLKDPGPLLGGGVLVLIVLGFMGAVPYLGIIATIVMTGPMMGSLLRMYIRRVRGGTVQVGEAFEGIGRRFGQQVMASLFPMLLHMAATLLPVMLFGGIAGATGLFNGRFNQASLVTLGVPLGLLWIFLSLANVALDTVLIYALPLVVDKEYKFIPAIKLSYHVAKKHFWQTFWFRFLGILLYIPGCLALCVGMLVVGCLIPLALAIQYDRLFRDLAPAKS